jgi:hypothetical protein
MKPATADNRWSWLPAMMPGVSALMADKRRQYGAPHVALCWKKGVIERQPGWFFAREGAIAVGTPFEDAALVEMSAARWTESQAFLAMASPQG